jgi:hypothetical protein
MLGLNLKTSGLRPSFDTAAPTQDERSQCDLR